MKTAFPGWLTLPILRLTGWSCGDVFLLWWSVKLRAQSFLSHSYNSVCSHILVKRWGTQVYIKVRWWAVCLSPACSNPELSGSAAAPGQSVQEHRKPSTLCVWFISPVCSVCTILSSLGGQLGLWWATSGSCCGASLQLGPLKPETSIWPSQKRFKLKYWFFYSCQLAAFNLCFLSTFSGNFNVSIACSFVWRQEHDPPFPMQCQYMLIKHYNNLLSCPVPIAFPYPTCGFSSWLFSCTTVWWKNAEHDEKNQILY